ncbi:calcium-responsive transcription factor-like [Oncorhynchus clarkii lewisi]|uniref:calcium-responsive transcription factor-like n=1 Tax=Oncorhynchus clarkii lewisi TaxID=490388 RepID=UPI0039B94FD4
MAYLEFKFEDEITKYIREQELATSLKFVILGKDKSFGQKDAQPLARKKLSWESKSIPFNGVPFQVVGTKTYECHQGKDRQTKAKEKYAAERDKKELEDHYFVKRRKLVQNTKKVDCKAIINIAQVIRFPDFKIEESTVRSKKEASQTLKAALSETPSSVKAEVVYCVRFPSLSEHSSHAVDGEAAHVREAVDVRLREKIEQLTLSGVRKMTEMKCHLNTFVVEELFHGEQPPPPTRRRYYPTDSDIRNVMFKTKRATGDSNIDRPYEGPSGRGKNRSSRKLLRLRRQCAGYLKEITELTYHLQEEQYVTDLSSQLRSVLLDMKAHVPQDKDLPLTFSPRKRKAEMDMDLIPTKSASHPFIDGLEQHTEDIVSVDTLLALSLG